MSFFGRVRLSRAVAQGSTGGGLRRTSGSPLSARSLQGAGCARYPAAAGPTPRLAPGRAIAASAVVPSAPLVTMVPWVPAPFQPLMDMLHPIMIKDRRPLEFLGISTKTNAGSLCGHLSFAILTAAYLETDVLTLRCEIMRSLMTLQQREGSPRRRQMTACTYSSRVPSLFCFCAICSASEELL